MNNSQMTDCIVCRKHRGIEVAPGGAIYQDGLIYISYASLWGDETDHYWGTYLSNQRGT